MIIDGHAHACGKFLTCNGVEAYLAQHKIDQVILCGGEPGSGRNYGYPMLSDFFKGEKLGYVFNKIIRRVTKLNHVADHIDEQNEVVWQMSKQLPGKIINAYWANPIDTDCVKKMEEFFNAKGFKILKLHQCWTSFDIENEKCLKIYEWAAEHKLPVFIHLLSHEQVVKFVHVANRFPDTVFIVAHMIGADYMANLLNNKNVYFDLSAPQMYSKKILKRAVENYGVERLVLGSDTPYGIDNVEKIQNRLRKLALTDEQCSLVFGENLIKILNL